MKARQPNSFPIAFHQAISTPMGGALNCNGRTINTLRNEWVKFLHTLRKDVRYPQAKLGWRLCHDGKDGDFQVELQKCDAHDIASKILLPDDEGHYFYHLWKRGPSDAEIEWAKNLR